MLWAEDQKGHRIEAVPRSRGTCPLCRTEVLPKCGETVQWHWAHKTCESCDPWSEGETPWHRWWKARAPVDRQEVVFGNHRADIQTDSGFIELQRSSIDAAEIRERESYYKKLIWIIDGRTMTLESMQFDFPVPRLEERPSLRTPEDRRAGRSYWEWRWPKPTFMAARKRVFFDLCGKVLGASRIFKEGKATLVEGQLFDRDVFLDKLKLMRPSGDTRTQPVSYLVQFRPKGERIVQHRPRADRIVLNYYEPPTTTAPYSLEWKEFPTLDRLHRWRARAEPGEVEVFVWRGDGSLTTDTGEPVRSTIGEKG